MRRFQYTSALPKRPAGMNYTLHLKKGYPLLSLDKEASWDAIAKLSKHKCFHISEVQLTLKREEIQMYIGCIILQVQSSSI